MTVTAKFTVTKVSVFGYQGGNGPHVCKMYANSEETEHPQKEITMSAVYGGSEENRSFAAATPNGTITFTLNNPAVAGEFEPGSTYYVEFKRAER